MELTITEYCNKTNFNKRYMQRIITAGEKSLLKKNHGISKTIKHGNTYILTITPKREKELNAL